MITLTDARRLRLIHTCSHWHYRFTGTRGARCVTCGVMCCTLAPYGPVQ